jgi:glycosyltransferase involved in cell wall biosynthesis
MSDPRISIYMPVYNGEKYIAEALRSLQSQTMANFEVVIVNDGSTDGTLKVVEEFCAKDSRFRSMSFEKNGGAAAARNAGWKLCNPNSPYLMDHDCDDISLPVKLERLMKYLDEHSDIDGVGCFADYIDAGGKIIGAPQIHWHHRKIRRTFARVNSMINSATLIRRKMLEKITPFDTIYPSTDDYDFWARALISGFELANIPEVLHQIRIHPETIGSTRKKEIKEHVDVISKYYRKESRRLLWNKLLRRTSAR